MADIPAANITDKERVSVGNKLLWTCKVKGDGTGVTIPIPLKRVDSFWVGNIDETAGYNPQLSFADGVLTYGAAPTNAKFHRLHVLGSD